ncbi:MAG: LysM peptidoglycan-binding domain-containing protein, partial [Actinomycetota bacterium]|nr:LysM peptidoglycan-binding domain-containing protein [Actinomycetota bacterium]
DRVDRVDRLDRPGARVYRRRRAVTLLALAAVVFATATLLRLALAGLGGGALTTAGSSGAAGSSVAAPAAGAAPGVGHVYVVQPGDSLWSIVLARGHRGDPRPEVDRLALKLNGRPLHVGQRLLIP